MVGNNKEGGSNTILEKYLRANPVTARVAANDNANDGLYLNNIELMLAQDMFQQTMNDTQILELEEKAEFIYTEKSKNADYYDDITRSTFYYALAQQQNQNVSARAVLCVYTPKGSAVQVDIKSGADANTIAAWNGYWGKTYPKHLSFLLLP